MSLAKFRALYGLPYPPSPEEALEHGVALYYSAELCENNIHNVRYAVDGSCYACSLESIKNTILSHIAIGDPLPTSPAMATELGQPTYLSGVPCKGGPHAEELDLKTGKCVHCPRKKRGRPRKDKPPKKPRKRGPKVRETARKKAIAAGQAWYLPEAPCTKCGNVRPRRVANGRCQCQESSLGAITSADETFMRDYPEVVIDRESAHKKGLAVYRTGLYCSHGHDGFRVVASGRCVPCLKR